MAKCAPSKGVSLMLIVLIMGLLGTPVPAKASADTLYTYILNDSNAERTFSLSQTKVYMDYAGSASIDEMLADAYQFDTLDIKSIPNQPAYTWFRFKIDNQAKNRIFKLISLCDQVDSVWMYSVEKDSLLSQFIPDPGVPPFENYLPFHNTYIPIILEPGSLHTYYLKVKFRKDAPLLHMLHGSIRSGRLHFGWLFQSYMQQFLYVGFMILLCLVSLIMFLFFKEQMFLYYALLLVGFILYFLRLHGLWTGLFPNSVLSMQVAISFIVLFLSAFTSSFLNLHSKFPKLNIAYLSFAIIQELLVHTFIIYYGSSKSITDAHNLSTLIWIVFTMIIILTLARKGSKSAKVLAWSVLVLFLSSMLFVMGLVGVIPSTNIIRNSFQIGTVLFSSALFYGLFAKITAIQRDRIKVQAEKDKSDELLFNILPAEIAEELKEKGESAARELEMISVLFTDFISFTKTAEQLEAKDLVSELNECFKAFDSICEKYQIEKIKTIGDAYMAAGGLSSSKVHDVRNTVMAGLEMADYMDKRNAIRNTDGKKDFEMRVGVHTGPVVAGVVGVKKFQYDIWGDTVNMASRMERHGMVGKVNVSQNTYELLRDDPQFKFEPRGEIEVKGKGDVEMYFVTLDREGIQGELS